MQCWLQVSCFTCESVGEQCLCFREHILWGLLVLSWCITFQLLLMCARYLGSIECCGVTITCCTDWISCVLAGTDLLLHPVYVTILTSSPALSIFIKIPVFIALFFQFAFNVKFPPGFFFFYGGGGGMKSCFVFFLWLSFDTFFP